MYILEFNIVIFSKLSARYYLEIIYFLRKNVSFLLSYVQISYTNKII